MKTLFAILFMTAALSAITPEEILKKADEVRNPSESYFLEVEVVDSDSTLPHQYRVAISGNNLSRFETLKPAKEKGKNYLMQDENMWVFLPNLKRETRVSLNQKLTGKASNGDISRMRWSGDYTPTIESETDKEWLLDLKANKKGLTYDRIRVQVEKESFHPTQGHYLTQTGKVLKNVTFTDYRQLAGRVRPNQIIIEDALRQGDKSTIYIKQMVVKNFPASLFKKTELGQDLIR